MKKTICLLCVLLAMITWYPLLVISGWVHEYRVTLHYPVITFIILALLFSSISLYLLLTKEKTVNTATSILSALLLPMSAVWLFISVWENLRFLVLLLALIWVVFSFALAFAYGSGVFLKGVLVGLTSLALVLLLPLMGFLLIFSFGQDTVVQTVYSPEATYYAEVIDSDQGALGGDTLVEVYNTKKKIELFFLTVQKNPQRVYFGEWGEFQTMKLEWESEQILLINGWPNEIE